jgi:alcohol dehydrogenase class IV
MKSLMRIMKGSLKRIAAKMPMLQRRLSLTPGFSPVLAHGAAVAVSTAYVIRAIRKAVETAGAEIQREHRPEGRC